MTPAWILDIFAALMLVVAAISAARLVAVRPWQRGAVVADTDIAHLLMAIAMAGMLTSSLTTLPNATWEVIFGVLIAWFAYRVVRDARANGVRALAGGHCAPHLAHSAAMLYMFLALAPAAGGGMGGMGGSSGSATGALRYPTLAFVFALVLAGYTVWDLDQLSSRRHSFTATGFRLPRAALAGAAVPAPVAGTAAAAAAFSGAQAAGGVSTDVRLPSAEADRGVQDRAATSGRAGIRAVLLSPGTTVGCRIAMGTTMVFMLLIMI